MQLGLLRRRQSDMVKMREVFLSRAKEDHMAGSGEGREGAKGVR